MKNRKSAVSLTPTLGDVAAASQKPLLNSDIQVRIGKHLGMLYENMVEQGIPDRFRILLERLDEPNKGDGERR